MRRLAPPVFLALLSACTVTTTGAPCTSDLSCPSDQGCGNDGACSVEALSCPGHTTAGQCVPGTSCVSGEIVTCTAASGVCSTRSVQSCADPGMTCAASGGGVACACPATNACTQLDTTQCSPTGDQILRCAPVVAGSACLAWQNGTSCAADGLVCSASTCVCPANSGSTFVADAIGGSPGGAPPHPTGLPSPVACRYRTLTEALGAANARGAGSTAMAAGWSAAVPGGVILFSEPGGMSIEAGVTLTTDEATSTPGHYVFSTPAALTGPLVELGPGGALAGFEIRNEASSGAGVGLACPAPADALPVSLSTVRISATSSGTPAARLATGIDVSGHCGVILTDVAVEGAATGVLVNPAAPGVPSTATRGRVTGSTVAGVVVIDGSLTFAGGSVDGNAAGVLVGTTGTGAPGFSATGTTFSGNGGDAVHVARGTVFTDACPFVNNGTHVHAQPTGGAAVSLTVQNSSGVARMTGASNSAFRLLAMGSGSTLVMNGNEVVGNDAVHSYNVATGPRRGGGVVLTAPFPGVVTVRGNSFFGNKWDQVLVAAGTGSLDLTGGTSCGAGSNSFGCYDNLNVSVGVYSNGAEVAADWNHWTVQPGVDGIDVGGTGVTGFDTLACSASSLICP